MWESVELREVRVFFVLAEELHFGRSAARLGLTQSRVSQTLRELERKLGGRLLDRTSRRVALTPLGERFLTEMRPASDQVTDVLARTQAATRRLEGTLRLGLLFPTSGGQHLTEIIEVFSDRHPAGVIQVSEVLFTDGLGPLQRGEIDILATRLPIKRPDLVVGPTLSRESRVLAIAHGHPLARRERISIEDIADYEVLPLSEFPHEMI